MAEPVFADEKPSAVTGSAGLSQGDGSASDPEAIFPWIFERAKQEKSRFQEGIEETDRLRQGQEEKSAQEQEKKSAQKRVQSALGRELLAGYELIRGITEETPWLIRVNQGTCTVTIYRILDIPKEEIPFSRGFDTIVKEAQQETETGNEAQQEQGTENGNEPVGTVSGRDASEDRESQKDIPSLEDFNPVLRELRPVVLRQFRKVKDTADPAPEREDVLLLPVYACPCSVGADGGTPNGTYQIMDHLRWHELIGPAWGQWCCHFASSFLFHSIPYSRPNDPNSLDQYAYNMLGKPASHGCVRLAAVDAKFIYDNIPSGTRVEVFTGGISDDPLGKPDRPFVGTWDRYYDPTDPEYRPQTQ